MISPLVLLDPENSGVNLFGLLRGHTFAAYGSSVAAGTAEGRAGGGCGRGSPPPAMGVRGVTPGTFFEFYIAVDKFWCIFMDQKSFYVHSLTIKRVKESHKKRFQLMSFLHNLLKFLYINSLIYL